MRSAEAQGPESGAPFRSRSRRLSQESKKKLVRGIAHV